MAKLPTPEETARKLLEIFVQDFNSRPGNVLQERNFLAAITRQKRGLAPEDFKPGMEFAVSRGWVEVLPTGGFKLTELGFEEA